MPTTNNYNTKQLKEQAKVVEQRLWYHFANTEGGFNIPEGLPFMKEFLNDVNKLVGIAKIIDTEKKPTRYRCLLCGRDKFTRKTPHRCVNGYRRRNIKWEEIYDTLSDE